MKTYPILPKPILEDIATMLDEALETVIEGVLEVLTVIIFGWRTAQTQVQTELLSTGKAVMESAFEVMGGHESECPHLLDSLHH